MNANPVTSSKRSAWPYAIVGYFAIAITGIACFITWAVKQNMDLVRNDYYEQEILFQKHLDAAARTKALGANAAINFNANTHALCVRVPAAHLAQSFSGKLRLYRPSDAKLDQRFELKPSAAGEQFLNTAQFVPGLWKARAEWTANDVAYVIESNLVIE